MSVYVIIAAGGQGTRLGGDVPKQWRLLGGQPMLARTVAACAAAQEVTGLVVVVPAADRERAALVCTSVSGGKPCLVVAGGVRRQDSVANGAAALPESAAVVLVHDAARPFVTAAVVSRVVAAARLHGAAIAAVAVHDSVKRVEAAADGYWCVGALPRDEVYLAQTPQGFRRDVFDAVIAIGHHAADATDEAGLAERAGHRVAVVAGDPDNLKVTTARDFETAERRIATDVVATQADARGDAMPRVGVGYDSHRFDEARSLVLGGVRVDGVAGLAGHSDGDAVCHAVTDAVLGAAGLGDIGGLFPDTDATWKDADSLELLRIAFGHVRAADYRVGNLDVVVICQRPKIGPLAAAMRAALAGALGCSPDRVSVKGKTPEGTPALADALVVHTVVLLTEV